MGFMDFFKRKSSGDVAKDRLKLLLVSDRANCSPDVMELIKKKKNNDWKKELWLSGFLFIIGKFR